MMEINGRFQFFFFNDTATTEIYTLSLHDALPICSLLAGRQSTRPRGRFRSSVSAPDLNRPRDRKSTRLNSSHDQISYAVFSLKKKNGAKPSGRSSPRPVRYGSH